MTMISQDRFVCLEYRLRSKAGKWIRGDEAAPAILTFVAGCQEVLPGLERRLWGLREQDRVEFVVPAAEAFGSYDPENFITWSRKSFPLDMEPYVGMKIIPKDLPFPPEYPLTVKEILDDKVVIDQNHPLAGQDLHYEVRVVEVRPATEEELEVIAKAKQCRECGDGDVYTLG